jgi:HEAT repeat protein
VGLSLAGVRPGERRDTAGAFLTLFGMMTGRSVLETARDALFLAKIAPERLPLVYIGIAVLAVTVSRFFRVSAPGRAALSTWIGGGALITLGFWLLIGRAGDWSLYALYIWTGLLSTLLVVRFWLLAADLFTVTQAKRVFALIGTGSILGAVAGSALAQAMTIRFGPGDMLLAAAVVLLAASAAPFLLRPPAPASRTGITSVENELSLRDTLREIIGHPYTLRLAGLILVSTVALTVADLLFKSTVAANVSADQLAWVFSLVYLTVNIFSLFAQLLVVGWLTRSFGIDRVLSLLPALLLVGAGWFAAGGGLLAAVLLKGFDGTLRHSLHRTATEVLSVPLPARIRSRVKSVIDVVGQRGGQALASLLFLGLMAMKLGPIPVGVALVALCLAWIGIAWSIKRHYFDLFRTSLERGSTQTRIRFPDLDLASLEAIMGALSSPDENKVVAALDLLAEKERGALVPSLILYHPAPRVIVRALELFEETGRTDHVELIARLVNRPEPEVRTAALLALPADATDPAVLERALSDDSADVRSTALVGLYLRDDTHPRVPSILETLLLAGSGEARQALARAIARRPHPRFTGVLRSLASSTDPFVAREVARAMRAAPNEDFLAPLRSMLVFRDARSEARESLLAIGDPAFRFLRDSLADASLPERVRRQLPRAIATFPAETAGPVLLERLAEEEDGGVRFKILRALGSLRRRHPALPLDNAVLDDAIRGTLSRTFRLLEWRVSLRGTAAGHEEWNTPVRRLVDELLKHKERHAVERLFRLFSLRYPKEDFKRIHRGTYGDAKARASARELLENVLQSPVREAVLGLLDDVPAAQRLPTGRTFHTIEDRDNAGVLRALLEQDNVPLRSLVAYHVGELGLDDLRTELAELCDSAADAQDNSFRVALDLLDDPQPENAFVVHLR